MPDSIFADRWENEMMVETFAFAKSIARAWLLSLVMVFSLAPSITGAAQPAREPKEVKVAYPPSIAYS